MMGEMSATPTMANRAFLMLSVICSNAVDNNVIEHNPCHRVKMYRENKRERYLTQDEQRRVIAALPDTPEGKLILLLLLTGARPIEWQAAQWDWINMETGMLRLPDSKRGPRTVYLDDQALAVLRSLPEPHSGPIFGPRSRLARTWQVVRDATGIDARMYDLRHTFASNALAAGEGLSQIGLTLGHRCADTTMRYAHLAPATGRQVARNANAHLTGAQHDAS